MNILIFTDTYEPQINGLVTSINILNEGLKKLNHTVYIIAPGKLFQKSNNKNIIYIPSIPYIFLPEYRITFLLSLKVIKLIKKIKFNVIHTHTPFSLGIMGAIIGKIFDIPVIHTYHTYFEEYIHYLKLPHYIGKAIAKYFSKFYCSLVKSIIVPSDFMKAVLKSYNIKKRINVIPTGINTLNFKVKKKNINFLKRKYNIKNNNKILLYVGRFAKEKNLYLLLDIFKEINNYLKQTRLLLVGDGPEKEHLEKYAQKHKIKNHIIWTGYIARAEIKNYYSISDIFVFPSLTETQGLVLLESMATQIPVVSFYKRGTKSVLPSKKIIGISPVKNKDEFIKEVIFYLNYNNKKKLKQNLKNYINKFNYINLTKKILKIYRFASDKNN